MKLIVGLGNPGNEYNNTRHNIGFMMLDDYLKSKNLIDYKSKFNGLYIDANINGEKVIFLKPQKYINLSGEVIKKYLDFYKIDISDLFIICDDLDLNVGNYKLKEKGSSGGHNGLKNIELNLNTKNYKRLKIGISNNKNIDTKNYVLSKLNKNDLNIYQNEESQIFRILDDFLIFEFTKLMNIYNHKNK